MIREKKSAGDEVEAWKMVCFGWICSSSVVTVVSMMS